MAPSTDPDADDLARLCTLLSNAHRLALVRALARREASAGEVARATGSSPSATSNRLKELAAGGLVESRRDGRRVMYRVAHPETRRILARMEAFAAVAGAHRR